MKKLLIGFSAIAVALVSASLFAAFEAHVVNVTATIENALSVETRAIKFGTVFPQEHLEKSLGISLSSSFLAEDRVDDIDYFIRQKPKCGITSQNGEVLDESATATGHVGLGPVDELVIDCGNPPRPTSTGETWGVLPSLCEYISKSSDGQPANDGRLPSFHEPFVFSGRQLVWNDTKGHLAKSQNDTSDNWTIDLAVPCFGGYCAQDWEDFVHSHNEFVEADDYIQPAENEHKVFGCDLWIEVTGISLPGLGCKGKVDLMLVLDRSGSIGPSDLTTLKNAAKAFVVALAPSADGAHSGQSSFATSGSLDLHLTSDTSTINAAIDALVTGGVTNLKEGINLAKGELDNPGDGHDRPDGESPDFMLIITDGAPNVGGTATTTAAQAAKLAADAAKAAGIEIFVVGVGTTTSTADYLKMDIATDASHYFDATDFGSLEAILVDIASCQAP